MIGIAPMANHKSAIKRLRQNHKRRARNRILKSTLKSAIKAAQESIEKKDKKIAEAALQHATSVIDKAVKHSILHRSTCSRKISNLASKVASL